MLKLNKLKRTGELMYDYKAQKETFPSPPPPPPPQHSHMDTQS